MLFRKLVKPLVIGGVVILCASSTAYCVAAAEAEGSVRPATVDIQYVCRTKGGEILATTDRKTTEDPGVKKSRLFLPPSNYGPVSVTIGEECSECPSDSKTKGLADFIADQLAKEATGLENGQRRTVTIKAKALEDLKESERYIKLMLVTRYPKETEMRKAVFVERLNKEPVVGFQVSDAALPGEVVAVEGDEVKIRLSPKDGAEIETPFGKGHVRDKGTEYEIVEDAKVGELVRTGPLLARISAVDETTFTLDFGEPFGGEELTCDFWVEDASEKK